VEQADPRQLNEPLYWSARTSGQISASFSHHTVGYTGQRSLKTQVTSAASGDAMWYYSSRSVKPGTTYKWSDVYRSDVTTRVVAKYKLTDGTYRTENLGSLTPSSAWRRASFNFLPASDVAAVHVMHVISNVGYLISDDMEISSQVATGDFSRGLVSLTFDDAWRSIYYHAMPLLTKYNYKSTQYVNTNPVKVATANTTSPYPYMMPSHVKEFHNKGHEIGSHTVNHPNLTTVSAAELNYQLTESKRYLTELNNTVPKNFASPYGAYNTTTLNAIMQHYRSNRSYNGAGYNRPFNFNVRNITTRNVYRNTTTAQIKAWIDEARSTKSWAVLVFHDIDPNPRQYGYTPAGLEVILQYLRSTNTPVVTVDQGIDSIQSARQ